jgi:hypothetical protein
MKRSIILLLSALLAVSCLGRSERIKVDIDKALKKQADARKLYTEATVIPLHCPEGMTVGQEEKVVLDVAADRFFLLGQNEILVFDGAGDYVTSITSEEPIIDFSAYRERVLDVLTSGAITEYDIKDGTLLTTYPLPDNDVHFTSIAKVEDDAFHMTGYQDGTAYDCGYLVNQARFYSGPRPAADHPVSHAYVPAAEMKTSRFFRCGEDVFNFCSRSGEIDRYENYFICVPYQWDFGKRSLTFTNAQKTDDRIYLAFDLDGKVYVLVYNLDNGKYSVVESKTFPLGVIYSGSNYYCDGRVIMRYTLP